MDVTLNKDDCLKYADVPKTPLAEVDTMTQGDPLLLTDSCSVYKVPTPLISTLITPS